MFVIGVQDNLVGSGLDMRPKLTKDCGKYKIWYLVALDKLS